MFSLPPGGACVGQGPLCATVSFIIVQNALLNVAIPQRPRLSDGAFLFTRFATSFRPLLCTELLPTRYNSISVTTCKRWYTYNMKLLHSVHQLVNAQTQIPKHQSSPVPLKPRESICLYRPKHLVSTTSCSQCSSSLYLGSSSWCPG
jgi:hypothetical protein